jgi:hypothetical protein
VPRLFITYATPDRDAVTKRIIPVVRDEGFDLWIDHGDIIGGDDYMARIYQGLNACEWYLIVLTPNSQKSEYVKDELHWAMMQRGGRIIPVMLADCDPYEFHMRLPRLQYVDFREPGDQAVAALRKVLRLARESDAHAGHIDMTRAQAPRDDKAELLAIVLTVVPREEQKHLRNLLVGKGDVRYVGRRSLRHELRRLCEIGALERKGDRHIGELTDGTERNLAEIVALTGVGKLLAQHVR